VTQIGKYIAPSRRPNALGVHSLDHFALVVPNLEDARRYYSAFGLDVREHGDALHIFTHGHPHRWGVLTEGSRKALQYLSFGIFADDVGEFQLRLQQAEVARLAPPSGIESNGFWFTDPDGNLIELKIAEKSSPDAKSAVKLETVGANKRGAPLRGQSLLARPRHMAHVLLFARDVPSMVAFYSRTLGLRLSDEAGGIIAFLHGIHGSDHHMIAFAKSDGPGFHHCSWDVGSIEDIGVGAAQMADKGFSEGWGLGRHVLGSNYFHYVRDPWGSYCEYSCDIDYVSADYDWDGAAHSIDNSIYLWGPEPPRDFTFNYEAAPEGLFNAGTRLQSGL
jgi:catechol 2,3-dioxygenase-like lactoylglutathione lyase family enzyme